MMNNQSTSTFKRPRRMDNQNTLTFKRRRRQESLPSESDYYSASGLKNLLHSVAYQLQLLMLTAIRCHERGYSFRMATEMDEAEKFDDLVLWYKKPGDDTQHAIFLKAIHSIGRHQSNIKFRDLIRNAYDRFNLQKYFTSYLKIKERQLADNGKFYIYTNIGFDFDENCEHEHLKRMSSFYFEPVEAESLLDNVQGCFYQLVDSPMPNDSSIVQQLRTTFNGAEQRDIAEFLKHFVFAVNQPNEIELSHIIERHFAQEFKVIGGKIAAKQFHDHIFNWLKMKEGTYYTNNNIESFLKDLREQLVQISSFGIPIERMKDFNEFQGSNLIHIAAEEGRLDTIKSLIASNEDVNRVNNKNETPLHYAAEGGFLEIVEYLLEQGANVNSVNNEEETPLHVAAYFGYLKVVQHLLEMNANVDAVNNENETALHMAARFGYTKVVNVLLKHGANVNAVNQINVTPLHLASQEGHFEIVQFLLQHGADVNLLDNNSKTALDLAVQEGLSEIIRILSEYNET